MIPAAESLLDLAWPRTCAVCGGPSDRPGRHVCAECLMRLPFVNPVGCCRVCGREAPAETSDWLCDDCRGRGEGAKPHFDRAASAMRFEGHARGMLHGFKFHRRLWLAEDLADALEAAVRARFDAAAADVVLPMPASLRHRWLRGYNQCAVLGRILARRLDRRFDAGVLRRVGSPKRQSELDEAARRENAKGTFAVRRPEYVRGRTVLVVDDIMTTGATLSEAARVLRQEGASRVWCATVARSVRI